MRIYFVRHAESEANQRDILASRMDFSLTDRGKFDAAELAREFSSRHAIDRLVSSPLLRARQTAEAFRTIFKLDIEIEDRLTEQELGRYSGRSYSELEKDTTYMHDRTRRWKWIPDGGGESYEMIAARVEAFFEDLPISDNKSTLFVSHAVTMRMIRGYLEHRLPDYPIEIAKNGELWVVDYQGPGIAHTVESRNLHSGSSRITRA